MFSAGMQSDSAPTLESVESSLVNFVKFVYIKETCVKSIVSCNKHHSFYLPDIFFFIFILLIFRRSIQGITFRCRTCHLKRSIIRNSNSSIQYNMEPVKEGTSYNHISFDQFHKTIHRSYIRLLQYSHKIQELKIEDNPCFTV
jgi:hypothetical protein